MCDILAVSEFSRNEQGAHVLNLSSQLTRSRSLCVRKSIYKVSSPASCLSFSTATKVIVVCNATYAPSAVIDRPEHDTARHLACLSCWHFLSLNFFKSGNLASCLASNYLRAQTAVIWHPPAQPNTVSNLFPPREDKMRTKCPCRLNAKVNRTGSSTNTMNAPLAQ